MESATQVTVVIPCRDTPEAFLTAALRSLREQTLTNWEAVVVDDGSVQRDVGRKVASLSDARFRFIRHADNRGEGAARNTGIRAARTEFIASLDADDMLHPDCLNASIQALKTDPDADWVLTDRQLFGESNDVLGWPVPLPPLCPAHFNAGSPGMFRRRVWEDVGGYCEEAIFRSGGADLDFWLSALETGVTPAHIARPLYYYRIHDGSTSATTFAYRQYDIHRAIYRRHKRLFDTFAADCPRCRVERRVPAYRSHGYVASAEAALARGERGRAVRLAFRAWTLDPRDGKVRHLLGSLISLGVRRLPWSMRART